MKFDLLHGILLALALLAGAIGFKGWEAEHDARIRMDATQQAQTVVISQADKREQQRNEELAQSLAAIRKQKDAVKTPEQAARAIAKGIAPILPEPITVKDATSPRDSTDIVVPQIDLKPISDAIADCRACQIENATLRQNLADEAEKMKALQTERDAAIRAAKGSKWTRFTSAVKYITFGAGIGALAVCASGHCR